MRFLALNFRKVYQQHYNEEVFVNNLCEDYLDKPPER
jgi:hypothetical protein